MAKSVHKPVKKEPSAKPVKKNIAVQAAEELLREVKAEEKPAAPVVVPVALPDAPPVVDPPLPVKKRNTFQEEVSDVFKAISWAISETFKGVPKLYLIGIGVLIVVVLFLWISGCNHNERIVKQNDKVIRPYQNELEKLRQERNTLQEKAKDDSIALLNALHFADVAHEENERLNDELRRAETELSAYLKKQKIQSDANKQVIKSGPDSQLNVLWQRLKWSKNIDQW